MARRQPFRQFTFRLSSCGDLSYRVVRVLLRDVGNDHYPVATRHEAEIAVPLRYLPPEAHGEFKADHHETVGPTGTTLERLPCKEICRLYRNEPYITPASDVNTILEEANAENSRRFISHARTVSLRRSTKAAIDHIEPKGHWCDSVGNMRRMGKVNRKSSQL